MLLWPRASKMCKLPKNDYFRLSPLCSSFLGDFAVVLLFLGGCWETPWLFLSFKALEADCYAPKARHFGGFWVVLLPLARSTFLDFFKIRGCCTSSLDFLKYSTPYYHSTDPPCSAALVQLL